MLTTQDQQHLILMTQAYRMYTIVYSSNIIVSAAHQSYGRQGWISYNNHYMLAKFQTFNADHFEEFILRTFSGNKISNFKQINRLKTRRNIPFHPYFWAGCPDRPQILDLCTSRTESASFVHQSAIALLSSTQLQYKCSKF